VGYHFFEGRVGLQRIALAIITICEKELLQCKVLEEVVPFLLNVPKHKIQPGVLLPAVYRVEIHTLMKQIGAKKPSPATTTPVAKSGSLFGFMNQLLSQLSNSPTKPIPRVLNKKTDEKKKGGIKVPF